MYAGVVVIVSGTGVTRVRDSFVRVLSGDGFCGGEEISDESGVMDDLGMGGVVVSAEVGTGERTSVIGGGSMDDKLCRVVEVSCKVVEECDIPISPNGIMYVSSDVSVIDTATLLQVGVLSVEVVKLN